MNPTDRLIELFKEFPGIGPRQAKRFVYFLLNRNPAYANDLAKLIGEVRGTVHSCNTCFRFFSIENVRHSVSNICSICRDGNRDKKLLMIISHDVDFENIEKRIRQKDLIEIIEKQSNDGLSEIIMALNYNPEGENTLSYLSQILKPITDKHGIKISTLGRGLSTGTELEYSDSDTIKNALKNRQ